ncbi:hypothetical protein D3C79_1082500 [compost metagenome]
MKTEDLIPVTATETHSPPLKQHMHMKKIYQRTDVILEKMRELMEEHPASSQKQLASMLGVSQGRISQLKKLM